MDLKRKCIRFALAKLLSRSHLRKALWIELKLKFYITADLGQILGVGLLLALKGCGLRGAERNFGPRGKNFV